MTYPGNSTLAADLQARIQETFQQTLDLAEKGNRQEAALGCDFILRLDPMFEPARTLQQRLQGGSGTLEIADLRTGTAAAAAPAAAAPFEPAEELFSDFDDLNLELPELPPAAAAEQDLRTRLTALLAARDF